MTTGTTEIQTAMADHHTARTNTFQTANWYVIHTKPRQERRAQENLQRQGFETFLPIYQVEKIQRSKLCLINEPLFRRYLFIRFDPDNSNWHVIRNTFGVTELVRLGGQLASIPDEVIQQLVKEADIPRALYTQGEHLRITHGPFQNLHAVFEVHDGDSRAIVLIELLNKTHKLKLEINALERN